MYNKMFENHRDEVNIASPTYFNYKNQTKKKDR